MGFQSVPNTFKAAHEKDASIRRDDVKTFLKKQKVVQDQSQKGTRFNSFVAHEPREEFQVWPTSDSAQIPGSASSV